MNDNTNFFVGKRTLITGGAGFIGSSLCLELVRRGSIVTILDALLPLYGGNLFNLDPVRDKITFVEGDIRNKELVKDLIRNQDLIFDLAAQVSYIDSRELPFLDLDINAVGHMNVLEAARLYAPQAKYIFSSSRLVYGKILTNPVTEEHPTAPLSLYGIHKLLVEHYCDYYFKTFGLKTIVVRLPNPYGPRQQVKHNKYSIPGWFMRQALEDQTIKIFGSGGQFRDYIYSDDIVSALLSLAEKGRAGEIYNIGTKEKVRFVDMVDTILKEVGTGGKEHIPWPEYYEKNETGDYFADNTKIETDTGWEATTSLNVGIRNMVRYYRSNLKAYWMGKDFSIELAAREYINKSFSNSTAAEKGEVIKKWLEKLKVGTGTADDVEKIIGSLKGKKILDGGSNLGIVSLGFAKKGAEVTGLENSKLCVGLASYIAQANKQKINFIYSSLGHLPLPDDSFDAVISVNVVNRISDCHRYLEEILRVLKPGGIVFLSFPTQVRKFLYNRRLSFDERGFYSHQYLHKELKNLSSKHGQLIIRENTSSQKGWIKRIIKCVLRIIGLPHTIFLPQAIVTLVKK